MLSQNIPVSACSIRVAIALGVIALIAAPLQAIEQVVRNDSVENFTTTVPIGDFVPGEQGGSRLTSPCNGSIVALQVLWVEPPPGGNPQSLQDAIHVYNGATFPTPGAELLLLEGPLLTPNAVNEFRFTDEAGTVPIDVPVTAGQQFYVTLEFGEPTDVGGGSASIVRDTDGCQAGKNVLFFSGSWHDFCSIQILLPGDTAIRAVVDCQEPAGACCDLNASCENDVEEGDCEDPGDTFFVGEDCGEVSCPQPVGACCDGSGGCLENQSQDFCENVLSRIYGGNGSTCADDICNTGACCLQDGTCEELIGLVCNTMNPTNFEGPGTSCAQSSCVQPTGACCVDIGGGNSVCVPGQTQANCSGSGDIWQGPFTNCSPDPCAAGNDGDMDDDGDVDLADLDLIMQCFGADVTLAPECEPANTDAGNNLIDIDDWTALVPLITGP